MGTVSIGAGTRRMTLSRLRSDLVCEALCLNDVKRQSMRFTSRFEEVS